MVCFLLKKLLDLKLIHWKRTRSYISAKMEPEDRFPYIIKANIIQIVRAESTHLRGI